MPDLSCTDDLLLFSEIEEDLSVTIERIVDNGKEAGLKGNANKSEILVLESKEGSVCDFIRDGMLSEYVSQFRNLAFVLEESEKDGAECCRKVDSGNFEICVM